MKKFIIILLVQFLSLCSLAQNLVPNPSFEANIGCPSGISQISNIISWTDVTSHTGSPDYYHTCATNAQVAVPNNSFGVEAAATGDAYVGLGLFVDVTLDYREYIEVQLSSPLSAGATYSVSFKYSLADDCNYSTPNFGIYFSPVPNVGANSSDPLPVVPQIISPVTLDNEVGWVTITQNFTAIGGEQYMVMGNFLDDVATVTNVVGAFGQPVSYIYLDDIVVEEICNYDLGNDTVICAGQTIPLDATSINATYLWHDGSINPTFTVTGPGIYWVEVTNICGTITDSIIVGAAQPLNLDFGNDTILCLGATWLLDVTRPNSTYLWQDNSTNATFDITQQGTYWVEISNTCQTVTDTIVVSYLVALNVNLGNDVVLCQGDMMTLNATSPNSTYLWQDNSTSPTYVVTQPGTYTVQVFSNCDSAVASINVDYFDPAELILGNDTVICQGDLLTLDVTLPNSTYLWQDNSTNATFDVVQEGSYWVELATGCGTVSDTINVGYLESLLIDLGNDTVLCEGEDLTLNLPVLNVNYLWQNNITSSSQIVDSPRLYYVEVGVVGCSVSDSIDVSFQSLLAQFDYQNTVSGCPKINTVNFTDQSSVNFGSIDAYEWSFNDGSVSISPNPLHVFYTYGEYDVNLAVTSNFGCIEFTDGVVTIDEYEEIEANFTHSPEGGVANKTVLDFSNFSQNSTSWIWDFGDGHVSDQENPTHIYSDAGTYTVTLIAENGIDCGDSVSRTLFVNEQIQVFVPNAFTPGTGGPNNEWIFSVLGIDIYDFSIVVFNRWGEVMWESHDPEASWNGAYNGELVLPGSYVWRMEINNTFTAEGESFYGTVNVLR